MTVPSVIWTNAFPQTRLGAVLKYIVESWEDLACNYPEAHAYSMREEKLTDSLTCHLDDPVRRQQRGIPGRFLCEQWNLRRLPNGKVKRESRSDIIYFDAVPGGPQLVVEFKKLAGTSKLHALYCLEGISRFVKGQYSPEQKVGVMCGILKPHCADPLALIGYLNSLALPVAIELGCNMAGYGVKSPSILAPAIATCDSIHARGPNCKSIDITLAHVFVTAAEPTS
jgi:hypothetical protein